MRMDPFEITVKNEKKVQIRSAEVSDAPELICYLQKTCTETPYLLREADELDGFTLEAEEAFLKNYQEQPNSLMLLAFMDGVHVGSCSFAPVSGVRRTAHRCSVGIALYQEFCGLGIGEQLLRTAMEQAAACGFEIMELDVVTTNEPAVHLYRKLGFEVCGEYRHAMKYKDGSYADEYRMCAKL